MKAKTIILLTFITKISLSSKFEVGIFYEHSIPALEYMSHRDFVADFNSNYNSSFGIAISYNDFLI